MPHVITIELRLSDEPEDSALEHALRDLGERLGATHVAFERRIEAPPGSDAGVAPLVAFVAEVVANETIWGLYGTTWARSRAAGDREALPFWSNRAAAVRCINGDWAEYGPRRIVLAEFLEQWLTGMEEDGIAAVLASERHDDGTVLEATQLRDALTVGVTDE